MESHASARKIGEDVYEIMVWFSQYIVDKKEEIMGCLGGSVG